MVGMTAILPAKTNVVAVVVATIAALFGRSWLQLKLLADGFQKDYAADLSYLVVPPILVVLLAPVILKDKAFLARQFRLTGLTLRTTLSAIVIGILARTAWWGQLFAGISFGIYRNNDPSAIEGPLFMFNCAAPHVVALGILVMAFMVPVIEELTHRSYVQMAFRHRGPVIAICLSAFVFAIFHRFSSWPFAFFTGLIFGVQYWKSGTLWPSLISHATLNTLIQVDWRCLNTQWNPRPEDLPLAVPGAAASSVALISLTAIFCLLRKHRGG